MSCKSSLAVTPGGIAFTSATAERVALHTASRHVVASLVYNVSRDKKTLPEALLLRSSIRKHDSNVAFVWFVSCDDVDQSGLQGMADVLLCPVTSSDLHAWRLHLGVAPTPHHSGEDLVWLKVAIPLLLPPPVMLVDIDTVVLRNWRALWSPPEVQRRRGAPSSSSGAQEGEPVGLGWGEERGHLNAGMLVWFPGPWLASWRSCLAGGASWYETLRRTDPWAFNTYIKRPEQNMMTRMCAAAGEQGRCGWSQCAGNWSERLAGCASLHCRPISPGLYGTGCDSRSRRTDANAGGAYHYNCGSHHHLTLQRIHNGTLWDEGEQGMPLRAADAAAAVLAAAPAPSNASDCALRHGQFGPPHNTSQFWKTLLDTHLVPTRKLKGSWARYYPAVSAAIARHFEGRRGARPLHVVEVGTAYGGNAEHLLKTIPDLELSAVDPFLAGYRDAGDKQGLRMMSTMQQFKVTNDAFSYAWAAGLAYEFRQRFGCRYHLYHEKSVNASIYFDDGSADAVFIDGLHSYEGVANDIRAWRPKVKPGGLMLFNDYGDRSGRMFPGVSKAVGEFARANNLTVQEGTAGYSNALIVLP